MNEPTPQSIEPPSASKPAPIVTPTRDVTEPPEGSFPYPFATANVLFGFGRSWRLDQE